MIFGSPDYFNLWHKCSSQDVTVFNEALESNELICHFWRHVAGGARNTVQTATSIRDARMEVVKTRGGEEKFPRLKRLLVGLRRSRAAPCDLMGSTVNIFL